MSISVATEYPGIAYDGTITFAGLLQRYFTENDKWGFNTGISRYWNDKTKRACKNDYEIRILPALFSCCGGNREIPVHEMKGELFEAVLNTLAEKHHYSDGTLEHYRLLIYRAYQAGVDHDHYPDALLWEEVFDEAAKNEDEKEAWRVSTMTRLRKSFSVTEEMRIADWFSSLEPESAAGEDIGLLLMFTLGLRNNEACGAAFSSIHLLSYHDDVTVFDMLQTTRLNSSELKSGGKTSNAPRTLLMMEPISGFIERRKEYLSRLAKKGELALSGEMSSVDDLPVVCRGLSFLERASSRDLAIAGKALFTKIGIDRSELTALFQILCSSEVQRLQIEDREPTTYLFRRNCATHLYQLGFAPPQIQYWMGHEIEDPFTQRSFFADPDVLYSLKEKWERHPLQYLLGDRKTQENELVSLPVAIKDAGQTKLKIAECREKRLLISAHVQEPESKMTVSLKCDTQGMKTNIQLVPKDQPYPRYADISEAVKRSYMKNMGEDTL